MRKILAVVAASAFLLSSTSAVFADEVAAPAAPVAQEGPLAPAEAAKPHDAALLTALLTGASGTFVIGIITVVVIAGVIVAISSTGSSSST